MKVGVIGAGIAGLTCAYRLAQKGVKSLIFEKEIGVGGRVPYCGAVATRSFQPKLISLIEELNLEELEIPLKIKDAGLFSDEGEMIGMEKLPMVGLKKFGLRGNFYFLKLNRFVNGLRFDIKNPDPRLIKLRQESFEEYLKDCPKIVRKFAVEPMMIYLFEKTFSDISAEYGLAHMRFGNELGSNKAFMFEENNIMTVTNVLGVKIEEMGSKIITSAEVKKVERKKNKFLITYEKEGEKQEEVDKIVLATPLSVTQKIFHDLNLDTNVEYVTSKCIFVEGKSRYPERKVIIGMPGNPANLRKWFNLVPYVQMVYPLEKEKEVDLEKLYTEYKVTEEKELAPAMPVIPPRGAKVPEVTTDIEGAYLCGDFFYYPFLETSVVTAEMAADLIN